MFAKKTKRKLRIKSVIKTNVGSLLTLFATHIIISCSTVDDSMHFLNDLCEFVVSCSHYFRTDCKSTKNEAQQYLDLLYLQEYGNQGV